MTLTDDLRRSTIEAAANAQWAAFPDFLKLNGDLKDCNRPPTERDFLVLAELHHLHILFLLHRIRSRQSHARSEEYLQVASRMLSLVVQAIINREGLISSENVLAWKVCRRVKAEHCLKSAYLNAGRMLWSSSRWYRCTRAAEPGHSSTISDTCSCTDHSKSMCSRRRNTARKHNPRRRCKLRVAIQCSQGD